jgi:hypothetical protein
VPHQGNRQLLFDQKNLQSLCEHHHNAVKQGIERRGYDKAIGNDGWPIDPMHSVNKNFLHDRGIDEKFFKLILRAAAQ